MFGKGFEPMKKNGLMAMLLASVVWSGRAENAVDKSEYTLINPTPKDLMREWYTDHSGNSPYTIDAGHFAADVGFSYFYDQYTTGPFTVTETGWAIGGTRVKVGLLDNLDVSASIVPYQTITMSAGGLRQTASGSGNLSTALKWNLWGNDGGTTALAISGGVTFPTGTGDFSDDLYTGFVGAEFAAHLPYGFMLQIDNSIGLADFSTTTNGPSRFEAAFGNFISVSHAIVNDVTAYCAFTTSVSTVAGSDWLGTIVVGVDYRVKENIELYIGDAFYVQPLDEHAFAPFG